MKSSPQSWGQWYKSSHSQGMGNCVEVSVSATGRIGVRDSKNRTGGTLDLPAETWSSFISELKKSLS